MLHEVLLALLGNSQVVIKDQGDGLKVQTGLPFLHSSDEEQLNYLCRLGTHYAALMTFIKNYGIGHSLPVPGSKKRDDIDGLYLKAFCSGLDQVLGSYRNKIINLETQVMQDPHLSVAHLVSQLQQYQLVLPALVAVMEQVTSHKAHGCYILDIVHKHSKTGHPLVSDILIRVLHACHEVMYKQLCGWLLYGYVHDPFKEFFIQPSDGKSADRSCDQASQSQEEDEDDLGIMGVTGRQLQKMLKLNVGDGGSSVSHLFAIQADLLPGYIPLRVANKILFVGESIQMFQDKRQSTQLMKGNILQGKQEQFAKDLRLLSEEVNFDSMKFESLINDIRTHVAEVLWKISVQDADLLAQLKIMKDFYLLGRGELYLEFIEHAHHLLKSPASTYTEHDVNAAFLRAARNVMFHDEGLLQRFRMRIKQPPKPQKKESVSCSSSNSSSVSSVAPTVEPGWNTLSLTYTVQWPLHIFFTPAVLDKYSRVFGFLLMVRRAQVDLQQCWTIQMSRQHKPSDQAENTKWQLRNHLMFLIDNLQYYLQVDVIESQYGILVEKISTTRDYEAVKLAHDHFLSALLAQSFVHMKTVADCLHEILSQCSVFTSLVVRCETPLMTHRDPQHLDSVAKSLQQQTSFLFKMLSSVRSHSSSPHLAQLLLRLDFNKYFSISGGQFCSY